MTLQPFQRSPRWALVVCGLMGLAAAGCQANVAGQTLPSAYFLRDDVQYFPAGEEFQFPNMLRAIEEYRLEQAAINEGLEP